MSFVATWMDLEISYKVKKVRERQIVYDITYCGNLKYGTKEPIHEIETESWTLRTDWWLLRGRVSGRLGLADAIYYIWNGQTRTCCIAWNCIRYPMINHKEKECKKCIYV